MALLPHFIGCGSKGDGRQSRRHGETAKLGSVSEREPADGSHE